jgi:tRNA(His) guanylyltransferase
MRFDDLDRKMRVFETAHDHCVLPGLLMVARVDGRAFTHFTRDVCPMEKPFDARFRDAMLDTAAHLMECGFNVLHVYTQSDEISLLFDPAEQAFGRKERKLNSVLAGEASACFSLRLGKLASFDCRISQLPNVELVGDYFRRRQEDAHRNALHGHCYWVLRGQGYSEAGAHEHLLGMSTAMKNELLFAQGINFNDLPLWQKRGVGLYWESYTKPGVDPRTGETTTAARRRIKRDLELPVRDEYVTFVQGLLG